MDLWAIDEVHFQQHGSRARMWIPPEVDDPVVLHHPTRKSVGYFGAVRLRDGKHTRTRTRARQRIPIPHLRLGKQIAFRRESLEKWIAALEAEVRQ